MKKYIIEELQSRAKRLGPLCIGLDTDPAYIPHYIVQSIGGGAAAAGLYNDLLLKAIAAEGLAPCVKVQAAYYEAEGVEGMKVFSATLKKARELGLITIADIKRGDIGATSTAYARAYFSGDFEADIVTLNPYMGRDALEPWVEWAKKGKGAFVLLCTSNSGADDIEKKDLSSGEKVYTLAGGMIKSFNDSLKRKSDKVDPIGAVVGATQKEEAEKIRGDYPDTFFLIPGFGAQGGDLAVVKTLLTSAGGVVNSSRAILKAWEKDKTLSDKRKAGSLSLSDIAKSAERAAADAKSILTSL